MLSTIVLALIAFVPQDDAGKMKTALAQAQVYAKAVVDGDVEKVIEMTNLVAIKAEGGKEKMIKDGNDAMAQMKKAGFALKELKVEPTKSISRVGKSLYCVLPKTSVIVGPGLKVTAKAFFLGASTDDGKTWTFLEGTPGEAAVRKLIPEIPKDFKFPAMEKPVVVNPSTEKTKP